jgi:hypothetical protein
MMNRLLQGATGRHPGIVRSRWDERLEHAQLCINFLCNLRHQPRGSFQEPEQCVAQIHCSESLSGSVRVFGNLIR